jgi:hypothetical protein
MTVHWTTLTVDEAMATQAAIDILSGCGWARPLLDRIRDAGGLTRENMSFLFEARFALALHHAGIAPIYEFPTGVGGTSVDFAFGPWRVELLSLGETDAARKATWERPPYVGRILSSPRPPASNEGEIDPEERDRRREERKQSPEGETLKAVERIVSKAGDVKTPSKFPAPDGQTWSMLVVDMRTFGSGHADDWDFDRIAWGAAAVPQYVRHTWFGDDGRAYPVLGIFNPANPMGGARHFRERVHFVGFVGERLYARDELQYAIRFYANPNLLCEDAARRILTVFPLYQPDKIRERMPERFLEEYFRQISKEVIQHAVVIDGRPVRYHVHNDTLENLEQGCIDPGSAAMLDVFRRHETTLRLVAVAKFRDGLTKSDGTIFIGPKDLRFLAIR